VVVDSRAVTGGAETKQQGLASEFKLAVRMLELKQNEKQMGDESTACC